jgi:trk system potassium uptake protein TrkA
MNVLIVGGGEVGTELASLLLVGKHRVKVIEVRQEEISRLQHVLSADMVISGNGTDPAVLEAAGVRQAHVVAAVTGADETNLVVTSLARFEFNAPRTIARVRSPKNAWMFTPALGVDVALNQADLLAHLIAEEMSVGDMMTLLKLRKGQYALVEERVAPAAVAAGKAVRDLTLPAECTLAAVIREGRLLIPHADLVLRPADEVLVLVHASQAEQLAALLGRADQPPIESGEDYEHDPT